MRQIISYVWSNRLTLVVEAKKLGGMSDSIATARPTLAGLAAVVARDANLTFGGGTATSEVMRRSLVKRGWISHDDHRDLYALSRLTPGTNLLAYCTGVGWLTRGASGTLVTLLAASIPSALISLAARSAYERLANSPSIGPVILLAMSIAVALLAASAWHLARPHLVRSLAVRSSILVALTFVLSAAGIEPIAVLALAAMFGAALPRPS